MKEILTTEDLAERWGVPEKSVLELMKERQVPFLQLGLRPAAEVTNGRRSYRFRLREIEAWESRNMQVVCDRKFAAYTDPTDEAQDRIARENGWDGKEY